MKTLHRWLWASWLLLVIGLPPALAAGDAGPVPFVVDLTHASEHQGRITFLQLDKILDDLGEKNLKIEVVAYEEGIHALMANNKDTYQLLIKLADRGVSFKACRISMRAWHLTEDDFPLEVEFVPAGAPEVIRREMEGYKYWHP